MPPGRVPVGRLHPSPPSLAAPALYLYGVWTSRVTSVSRTPGSGRIPNALRTNRWLCPPPSSTRSCTRGGSVSLVRARLGSAGRPRCTVRSPPPCQAYALSPWPLYQRTSPRQTLTTGAACISALGLAARFGCRDCCCGRCRSAPPHQTGALTGRQKGKAKNIDLSFHSFLVWFRCGRGVAE